MEMNMNTEGYKGVGRTARRSVIRRWKASGSKQSLKQWARQQGIGDEAYVWALAKAGGAK